MSDPFYGLAPVYLPFSGTTDSKGNFTQILRPRAAFWFTGKLTGQVVSGNPAWRASDGVIPIGFSRGQRAEMGGIVIPPNASLVLEVLGAQPSTTVTGALMGKQGADLASIAASTVLTANTVTAETQYTRIQLPGSPLPAITPGNQQAQTFTLPPNTVALRVLLGGGASFTTSNFQAIGQTTQIDYALTLSVAGSVPTFTNKSGVITIPVDAEVDSQVQVVITNSGASANNITAWVSALLSPEAVDIYTNPALPIFADITDRNNRVLGNLGTLPPPWQTPLGTPAQWRNQTIAAGGNLTVIAGVANQNIWLFEFDMDDLAADTAQFCDLETTDGTIIVHQFVSHPGGHDHKSFNGQKVLAAVGSLGIRIHNFGGAGITVSGSLTNSQQ